MSHEFCKSTILLITKYQVSLEECSETLAESLWPPFLFQDVDLNHFRIGKIEGFEVLKKVKVTVLRNRECLLELGVLHVWPIREQTWSLSLAEILTSSPDAWPICRVGIKMLGICKLVLEVNEREHIRVKSKRCILYLHRLNIHVEYCRLERTSGSP